MIRIGTFLQTVVYLLILSECIRIVLSFKTKNDLYRLTLLDCLDFAQWLLFPISRRSCNPVTLFDAEVEKYCPENYVDIKVYLLIYYQDYVLYMLFTGLVPVHGVA